MSDKQLPNFLLNKSNKPNQFYLFGNELFIRSLPSVLYRYKETENDFKYLFHNDPEHIFPKAFHIYTGDINNVIVEYYHPLDRAWYQLDSFAKIKVIWQEDIDYLNENYSKYYEIEMYSSNAWIKFDLQKWVHDCISPLIDIDLERGKAFTSDSVKYDIPELKEWTDPDWRSYEDGTIVLNSLSLLNKTLVKLKEDLKVVKLDSDYLNLFNLVKTGVYGYDDFLRAIKK